MYNMNVNVRVKSWTIISSSTAKKYVDHYMYHWFKVWFT